MLVIRAVSFKGRPVDREISGRFSEAGGTIGRGETSTLVLPDPERYISRTHAAVAFQAGGYVITDSGSKNPIRLNGRAVGPGSQARLSDGDRIEIGDYALEVALPARKDDPRGAFGGPSPKDDPFADLLRPPSAGKSPQREAPDALRPWPEPPASQPPPPRRGADRPDDPLGDLRGPEPSIEELFGLKGQPAADLDELLGGPSRPAPRQAIPDQGSELFTPYTPPRAKPDPVFDAVVNPPPPPAPSAPAPEVSAPRPPVEPVRAIGPTDDVLLQAFLKGAGLTGARLTELTPETMESVGGLLREAVQGTLDLLRARGLTKSELRADVTMVMATDNNPLKFSPSVEAALTHFLATPVPGFMPPLRAMKEAYDDLRAHQLGFLAGMRAALDEVLARFSPEQLETRVSSAGMLDSVLPSRRKAKLWDVFVERHSDVVEAAREDFNATFGKAFVRAYQAQVKRLRAEAGAPGLTPGPGADAKRSAPRRADR